MKTIAPFLILFSPIPAPCTSKLDKQFDSNYARCFVKNVSSRCNAKSYSSLDAAEKTHRKNPGRSFLMDNPGVKSNPKSFTIPKYNARSRSSSVPSWGKNSLRSNQQNNPHDAGKCGTFHFVNNSCNRSLRAFNRS